MEDTLIPKEGPSSMERRTQEFSERVYTIRSISLMVLLIASLQLVLACVLPDILSPTLKICLLSIMASILLVLLVAHIVARRDVAIMLFINFITPCIAGFIIGIALTIIVLKVEK